MPGGAVGHPAALLVVRRALRLQRVRRAAGRRRARPRRRAACCSAASGSGCGRAGARGVGCGAASRGGLCACVGLRWRCCAAASTDTPARHPDSRAFPQIRWGHVSQDCRPKSSAQFFVIPRIRQWDGQFIFLNVVFSQWRRPEPPRESGWGRPTESTLDGRGPSQACSRLRRPGACAHRPGTPKRRAPVVHR